MGARVLACTGLALLAFGLGGCGAVAPQPPLAGSASEAGRGVALTIRPAYQAMATRHRWVAADVHRYEVTLRAWNGSGFVDLDPPLAVTLPQTGADPKRRAVFTNLKQGWRYQATVVAWGNVGGTASELVLNAQAPAQLAFSFESAQDVEGLLARDVSVALDPTPFSGTFTLQVANAPAGTDAFEARLEDADSGATLYAGSYPASQTMVLRHLRVGTRYRVRLDALANGASLQQATSNVLYFDPQGQDLEQDLTVPIAF